MLLRQNFQVALRALRANKMRSILTMLGIIIGVAAVVALLAIGEGATASITDQVAGAGSNLVFIRPGAQAMSMRNMSGGSTSFLYYKDYEMLASQFKLDAKISPLVQASYPVKYGNQTFTYSISAITPDYLEVRSYSVEKGRSFDPNGKDTDRQVAIIGSTVASDLFGPLSALGKDIKINGVRFEVIGLLESKGASGMEDSDSTIMIPLQVGYSRLVGDSASNNGEKTVNAIMISVNNSDRVNEVMTQADYLLRRAHKIKNLEDADFSIQSQNDMLSMLNTITATMTAFLGAIAAISLLVGGIGIMNIMLVSVTERTKEIGLRKAVGARKQQILMQFLVETMTLSVLGGLIGILLGTGIAGLVTVLNLIQAKVSLDSILLAFGFSAMIGLFFGLYPANRAASLHPIEALRYE
jgi:putative ABC transport system permease protein